MINSKKSIFVLLIDFIYLTLLELIMYNNGGLNYKNTM